MKIVLLRKKQGHSALLPVWLSWCVLSLFGVSLMISSYSVYRFFVPSNNVIVSAHVADKWQQRIESQAEELAKTQNYTRQKINVLRIRLAELQSRLTRLDALGERLVDMADLADGEFDFSMPPALGGPESESLDYQEPDFIAILDDLSQQISDREQQLKVLKSLLGDRKIQSDTFVAGRPIDRGWMSSRYGFRNDPFTGKRSWHDGVDFAGKEGSDIVSVAAGVVTWAGTRYGYGNLVEISHGSGYVTRYAHSKEILVNVGDVVKKNDVIALIGSTGRSTGPHVHFEVLLKGRSVDPTKYINRVSRF